MTEPPDPGAVRVSDNDRQSVVDRLSRACGDGLVTLDEFAERAETAYAAVTRAELDAVTADLRLPVPVDVVAPAPSVGPEPAVEAAARPRRKWMVAVMGSEERRGRWRANRRMGAFALMGGVDIDLRDALLDGPEVEITAWAIMGAVEVIVPEGIVVETSGFVLMGGRSNKIKDVEPVAGAPTIRVKGFGLWGAVDVRSKRSTAEEAAARDRRRAERAARRTERRNPGPPRRPGPRTASGPAALPPAGAPEGGLVTVVCTDIVGSTRLADRLGDQTWRGVLQAHNALVREHLARHGGVEVKTSGDGFLLTFGSARRAVRFAVELQAALAGYRAEHPEAPLEARIGIHAGEVERDGHDVVGRNVSLASRLCDASAPGEVLASAIVADLADSSSDVVFGPVRELALAGIDRPVRAHPASST